MSCLQRNCSLLYMSHSMRSCSRWRPWCKPHGRAASAAGKPSASPSGSSRARSWDHKKWSQPPALACAAAATWRQLGGGSLALRLPCGCHGCGRAVRHRRASQLGNEETQCTRKQRPVRRRRWRWRWRSGPPQLHEACTACRLPIPLRAQGRWAALRRKAAPREHRCELLGGSWTEPPAEATPSECSSARIWSWWPPRGIQRPCESTAAPCRQLVPQPSTSEVPPEWPCPSHWRHPSVWRPTLRWVRGPLPAARSVACRRTARADRRVSRMQHSNHAHQHAPRLT
mmetsp:Transcript_131708/g.328437  ORF Transcript_131708/g.328437 Transcript_131708/m.328437 type:complete len:285 (-) Transcript_131708:205-1059(-)